MKKIVNIIFKLTFMLIIIGLSECVYAQPANRNLDIYLLIGQSNMGGRGTITAQYSGPIPDVWVFRGEDDWGPGQNPFNYYSTIQGGDLNRMGPGWGFVTKMKTLVPNAKIGIVSNARGATGLDSWMPGTNYYNQAVQRALLAMEYGTIKGVLWHQGEQDAKLVDPTHIDTYLSRITIMINSLRADLGVPNLPFIAGQIFPKGGNYGQFNTMMANGFAGILPNTDLVYSNGLTSNDWNDNVHFDTESQRILGERYADKIFPLISSGCSITPHININNQGWNSVGTANVSVGDSIWFGPQSTEFGPTTSGWSYTGPNGFTYSGRSLTINNIQANQAGTYVVSNTDANGCTSTYTFVVNIAGAGPSQLSVNIQGTGFTTRAFTNGVDFFTNRTYVIQNAPSAFANFQFAANDGGSVQGGSIVPSSNGFVYIVAPIGGVSGWDLVPNSTFNYSDGNQTSVSIYQKAATANVAVTIPNVTSFPGASPIAKTITNNALPSQIGINIQGSGFTTRAFTNGVDFFTNRTYVIQNAPSAFAGFQLAANDGGSVQGGSIIPSSNGFVYIVAPIGGVSGWDLVPNSTFNYSDGNQTSVSIYQRAATANVAVTIPTVTSFPGASPIAKTIQLGSLPVLVDGTGFEKRGFETGSVFFTNRTYQIENAPTAFEGYEFLASNGGSAQSGTITSPVDGFVYIIAPTTGVSGWALVPNSTFNYSDTSQTSVSIFQKAAVANVAIAIPNVTSFPGASPLAEAIILNGTAKSITSKTLSIENLDSTEEQFFVVYPNPAKDFFNLQLSGVNNADVSIFSLDGRLLFNKKYTGTVLNINNQNLFKAGLYIINVIIANGNILSKRLIIN